MKVQRFPMVFFAIVLLSIAVASCKKENERISNVQTTSNAIKINAFQLSRTHDDFLVEMLNYTSELSRFKGDEVISLNDILDVIENVIGSRPMVLNDISEISDSMPVFDLNNTAIRFANYATSDNIQLYLNSIDSILDDAVDNDDMSILINELNLIEERVLRDNNASVTEKQTITNTIEVFKGSIALWDSLVMDYDDRGNPQNWSRWRKILFIAAADAIGALLGMYYFGVVTVGNYIFFVPPGTGVAGMAAAVSFIATCFVGWGG